MHKMGQWIRIFSPTEDPGFQQFCLAVSDNLNPNSIQIFPQGVGGEGFVFPKRPLDYVVNFQNSGNDTVRKVVGEVYLDSDLDLGSFQPGPSSHPFQYFLTGTGIPKISFEFDNINLPKNSTNLFESQGFVKFRIWPKSDVPSGTESIMWLKFSLIPKIWSEQTMY